MYVLRNFHKTPVEEIKGVFPDHLRWIADRQRSGHFVFAGPQQPRVGGLILARAKSIDEVWSIVDEDPFGSAVTYDVTAVYPTSYSDEFEAFLTPPDEREHTWRSRPAPGVEGAP